MYFDNFNALMSLCVKIIEQNLAAFALYRIINIEQLVPKSVVHLSNKGVKMQKGILNEDVNLNELQQDLIT